MALIDLANPTRFRTLAETLLPWLAAATVVAFGFGLERAYLAPDDYQQGATVKIMFLHVPSAWLSMMAWGPRTIPRSIAGSVDQCPPAACACSIIRVRTRRRRISLHMAARCRVKNKSVNAIAMTNSGTRRLASMVEPPMRNTEAG